MQHHDYDAVVYDGDIYCIGCLPDGVDVNDTDQYDNDICAPIFAGSEWDYAPVCCVCSELHDYVTVIDYDE